MKTAIYEGILDRLGLPEDVRAFYERIKRSKPVGRCIHCNAVMLKEDDMIFSSNVTTDCYCNGRLNGDQAGH